MSKYPKIKVVYDYFVEKSEPLGGIGEIVEIDESKFGKRKYHRGHRVEGQWVFGGIQRSNGRVFMDDDDDEIEVVENWLDDDQY